MSDRSQRALAAALRAATDLGLPATDPRILRDRYNLLVHLPAAGVVVRVATATAELRGPEWLEREVGVARFLAEAGLPVVPPATTVDPGPHHVDGFTLSIWDYVDVLPPETLDPALAGRALRACHDALVRWTPAGPAFPVIDEARELARHHAATGLLTVDDHARFEHLADGFAAALADLAPPMQQVHGDAHLGNALATARGPLWSDWEDTIAAPREWDLATALANGVPPLNFGNGSGGRALVDAYGSHDAELLGLMREIRILQGVAWGLAVGPKTPHDPRPAMRLAWLREHPG